MSSDRTQQQSSEQIKSAKDLSLQPRQPPSSVTGYVIDSLLGSGAYGEVWMALDQKTGRRVAIKFYTRKSALDFSLLSREVEKLVFLSADRYVVQLLNVGWDADPPYYVMDFIENGSLEDELSRRGSMPVTEAIEMAEEICIGLMHLHGKGILHCDLKPGNVLLDQDKKPRLADFGQSRLSHEQTPALGTLFFMAPEQADLKAVPDAKWDVYALGALLYCMLTGVPPFRDTPTHKNIQSSDEIEDRLLQYRAMIDSAPKPTAHRKVPGVDRTLAEIIDRCIDRNPNRRYGSVQSVLQALQQREISLAMRPLMILGIVGPLLLLAVMSLLAWNAYLGARSESDRTVTQSTLENNNWVAQLAARSAAEQLDKYFSAVDQLRRDPDFLETMKMLVTGKDKYFRNLVDQLSDPHNNANVSLGQLRQDLIDYEPRKRKIQKRLKDNLENPSYPTAASWFVCDYTGTQIASVFRDEAANTIGKNYSYRTYFTGQAADAETVVDDQSVFHVNSDINSRKHIKAMHMSAIFESTATNRWKIAISAPVVSEDETFLGVVAVTADMGSLIEFEDAGNQYVILVDDRAGERRGTILEHPYLDNLKRENKEVSKDIITQQVGENVLEAFDRYDSENNPAHSDNRKKVTPALESFQDPMGEMEKEYQRNWIASWADVERRTGNDSQSPGRTKTGFRVIAVKDHAEAMVPTEQLGKRLAISGSLALLFFLLVTGGLLFIVFRSLRHSRQRAARLLTAIGDSTAIHEMSTVMLPAVAAATERNN